MRDRPKDEMWAFPAGWGTELRLDERLLHPPAALRAMVRRVPPEPRSGDMSSVTMKAPRS